MKRLLMACVVAVVPGVAVGQTAEELMEMSRRGYAAWECAAYSSIAKNDAEQERLFRLGFDLQKTFIEAAIARKVTMEEMSSGIPWPVLHSMKGPSVDFMLGALWTFVYDDLLDVVPFSDADDVRISKAEDRYRDKNCQFVQ